MSEEVNKNQEEEKKANSEQQNPESAENLAQDAETPKEKKEAEVAESDELTEDESNEAKSEEESVKPTSSDTNKEKATEETSNPKQETEEEIVEDENNSETSEELKDSKTAEDELDEANAEDSEDDDVSKRHEIELKDYETMSLDELVLELEKLLNNEKIQAIREHVSQIKIAFDKKFNEIIEEKKEAFIEEGGNIIDFQYTSPVKKNFNSIYFDYREKRDQYYSQLKKNLNQNLNERLSIIEELKSMIGAGESMNSTFQHFKDLQERWKNAGPIPKTEYREVWKNYHFHVERFYDFLHLDREFRDLDFKHNLDQKLKLIQRAEELTKEEDVNRAFRELQLLHKMWKEELGPVAREYREEIWKKFSDATQEIHDKRQAHFEELDKEREKNLAVKEEVIEEIRKIAEQEVSSHKDAQTKIKNIEKLREIFFKAGKVPRKDMDDVWNAFKKNTRTFNRKKNAFYKNLKQEQFDNLKKKQDLIQVAEEHKDSEDFETVTPLMKKIQDEWKKIGHVPRKDSDKVWKQFKKACNHYFDRLHSKKNEDLDEEFKAFLSKKEMINQIKSSKLPTDQAEALKKIEGYIEEWGNLGSVPRNKKYIEGKFNKALDQLFKKIGVEKKEAELLKYESRLQDLDEGSDKAVNNEIFFLRKKIDETKDKINQFENNLQFFSSKDDSNPLVKEVKDKIEKYREELSMWKTKLDKLNQL